MGTPELNKKLKKIKGFDVFENDIQYREGIIDVLKKENNFNILIIYEKLPGEINLENLIKDIRMINNKINIIFILENKNEKLKNILFNENIKNIFYNDEINFKEFIFKLKKLEFSEEEILKKEINKLNKIILEKNNELLKYKNMDENKDNNLNNKTKNLKKVVIIANTEFNDIKNTRKLMDIMKKNNLINSEKINILFFENNKNNKNNINLKLLKNIFNNYKIIGKIKIKNNNLIIDKKYLKNNLKINKN
jgi:hypothetical protein